MGWGGRPDLRGTWGGESSSSLKVTGKDFTGVAATNKSSSLEELSRTTGVSWEIPREVEGVGPGGAGGGAEDFPRDEQGVSSKKDVASTEARSLSKRTCLSSRRTNSKFSAAAVASRAALTQRAILQPGGRGQVASCHKDRRVRTHRTKPLPIFRRKT